MWQIYNYSFWSIRRINKLVYIWDPIDKQINIQLWQRWLYCTKVKSSESRKLVCSSLMCRKFLVVFEWHRKIHLNNYFERIKVVKINNWSLEFIHTQKWGWCCVFKLTGDICESFLEIETFHIFQTRGRTHKRRFTNWLTNFFRILRIFIVLWWRYGYSTTHIRWLLVIRHDIGWYWF